MTERGVLDTSVFIATESGRFLDVQRLPSEVAVSVVTLAELRAGVLAAADTEVRAIRMVTVDQLSDMHMIPVDEQVALVWAQMRATLVETGRRVNVNDLWIAASAASRGWPLYTQDDDFGPLQGVAGLSVVQV